MWTRVRLTALFSDDRDSRFRAEQLAQTLATELGEPPDCEPLPDQAWERVWLNDIAPLRFGRRLWVCPRGQKPKEPKAVILELGRYLSEGIPC